MQRRPVCAGCRRPISDKFLLQVADGLRHEACARCSACGDSLRDSCFVRGQRLYCKRDYAKLFAVRCGGCFEGISPTELVLRAGPAVFHLRCFTCSVCSAPMRTGDCCVVREGLLVCAREDYHRRAASPTSSDTGKSDDADEEEDEEEDSGKVTSRRIRSDEQESKRPKRPRTILTTQQRRIFKASFEVSSKPCRKVRETLAADTGLTVRVVQVWFQNQRAKMKKLARRQQQQEQEQPTREQQQQPSHRKAPPNGEPTSKLEHLGSPYSQVQQQQQMGFTRMEQQDFDMDPFRQGLTPPQMPGDHMHPYGFTALYSDVVDTVCLSLGDNSSLLTPMDCLYSMQDSYFTS